MPALAVQKGDCSAERGLVGRTDIVFCEPWDNATWWQTDYVRDGSKSDPQPPTSGQMTLTSIVQAGCISGSCLKVDMPQGVPSSLSIVWPLSAAGLAPEQLYLRYYIKLGPAWNASETDPNSKGGKLPGLADPRTTADPSSQCGNGGEPSDGINCWTMRGGFAGCTYTLNGPHDACVDAGHPNATMRFDSYLYYPGQENATGSAGIWDSFPDIGPNTGAACSTPSDIECGIGTGGMFDNDRWYLVEMFVKMNTPGSSDGIIRGWIDGVLNYQKTNMIFRLVGHDNLHVRTLWIIVYKGGSLGNLSDSEIYLDQLVAATDNQIGAISTSPIITRPLRGMLLRILLLLGLIPLWYYLVPTRGAA